MIEFKIYINTKKINAQRVSKFFGVVIDLHQDTVRVI